MGKLGGRKNKKVFTNTSKKGLQLKEKTVVEVRRCVDEYERVFVYSVQNMRNGKLKDLREDWKSDSRFFFGKNRVMRVALGKDKQDEYGDNLHRVSKHLLGQCGLLFTNKSKKEVLEFFNSYSVPEYARSGFVATKDVVIPEGPLPDFSAALESQLRQLGMPTRLMKGVIHLASDYTVCKKGSVLTPEKAQILKLKGIQMAEFRVIVLCVWDKDGGRFQSLVKNIAKKEKEKQINSSVEEENFELKMDDDNNSTGDVDDKEDDDDDEEEEMEDENDEEESD